MSTTAFWGDVAECRRLLRHYRLVQDEVSKRSPGWRLARRVVPWVIIPVLAFPWWRLLDISFWFGLGPLSVVLLGTLPHQPPWKLTTFEALHMPSRRSLFVARLLPWLPWWLWGGLWGTAGLLLAYWEAVPDGGQAVVYLLIGAQVPWLALGLLGACTLLSRIWNRAGCVALVMFLVFIPSTLGILIPLLRQSQAIGAILALLAPGMLLLEVGLLALQVWVLDRLEPMHQINPLLGTLQDMELAQQKVRMPWTPRSAEWRGQLGPAPLLAGRHGLAWAAAYYACFKLWDGGLRGFLGRFLQYGVLLFFPFTFLASGKDQIWLWIVMASLIFSSVMTGSVVQGSSPQRLYLLGVDYRCQLNYRLKTFWITPAALVILLAALLTWVVGKPETALTLLAMWAGLTLLCECWFGWPALTALLHGQWGCLSQLLVLVLWAALLAWVDLDLGSTETRVQLFAAACGAFGLAGILYKWWRLDEDRLADAVAAAPMMVAAGVTSPGQGPGHQPG
jgi:hypothetical protein